MTDHSRYSPPPQPPHQGPNQHVAPGYSHPPRTAGYQQPYDWRYATQEQQPQYRQPYDPYQAVRQGNLTTSPNYGPMPPRRRSRAGMLAAGALAIAVVSAGIGGTVVLLAHPDRQPAGSVLQASPNGGANVPAANLPVGSVEQVAAKVVPSVVKLETEFGRQSEEGSGIILSSDGLILTNNHVVAAAKGGAPAPAAPPPIPGLPGVPLAPGGPSGPSAPVGGAPTTTVTFADGRTASFTVIGTDPASDIAVVRAQGVSGLTPITLGSSGNLRVGQDVVAVGSPLGLEGTVTTGIVSALNRPVATGGDTNNQNTVLDAIQTDAAINPGNSGGALVDTEGRLLGINTAIYSRTGGSLGIGFAIPASTARQVMEQIVATGSVTRGYIGVEPQDLTPELAEAFKLPRKDGAIIAGVMRNGPADRAGVKVGDILVEVEGQQVTNTATMLNVIAQLKPGSTARFRFVRDSSTIEIPIRIGKRPKPGAPRE